MFRRGESSTHGLVRRTEASRISHIAAHAAHQGRLVLIYAIEKPEIIRGCDILDGFQTKLLAFLIRDSQEIDRRRVPFI